MATLGAHCDVQIKVYKSDLDVARESCQFIADMVKKILNEKEVFTIGLSGGSAAKYLCDGLPKLDIDWSRWRVFFCDERHVPHDDPECTFKFYEENLMTKVPLLEENVFPDNPDIPLEQAAKEYEGKLKSVFGEELPKFDLLVLGMGPDGHTCSLFPGHPLLEEKSTWVAPISDSPKPPPQRITMTFPVINNCENAMFISCGQGKAAMVQHVLEGKEDPPLPASRVKPTNGTVHWFLDEPAASSLTSKV